MLKKFNIVKRAVPVLVSAIAVSALYTEIARADYTPQTIYIEDIFDEITVSAGYYENDTVIKTALEAPSEFIAAPYTGGANNYLSAYPQTEVGTIPLEGYYNGEEYNIDLGVDEQMVLTPGYYYNNITIKNGVADRGDPSAILNGDSQSVNLPAGYYSDGTVSISPEWNNLVASLNTTFGTAFTGNEKFSEIAGSISGEEFSLNRNGSASYAPKTSGDNTRIGTSAENTQITDIPLAGKTIDLGVDESITIPAGYYGEAITIQSGVVHQEAVDTTVSANNNSTRGLNEVAYGPGYYDSIVVKDNTSKGAITKTSGGTTKTWNPTTLSWN